jgi:hypothetical protein
MKARRWFRIRAVYGCTAINLIVWGSDVEDAKHRAAWWQKGALAYWDLGEVDAPY